MDNHTIPHAHDALTALDSYILAMSADAAQKANEFLLVAKDLLSFVPDNHKNQHKSTIEALDTWLPLAKAMQLEDGAEHRGVARFADREWMDSLKVALQAYKMSMEKSRLANDCVKASGFKAFLDNACEKMMRLRDAYQKKVTDSADTMLADFAKVVRGFGDGTQEWDNGLSDDANVGTIVEMAAKTLLTIDAKRFEDYADRLPKKLAEVQDAYSLFEQAPPDATHQSLSKAIDRARAVLCVALAAFAYTTYKAQPTTLAKRLLKQRSYAQSFKIEGLLPRAMWADLKAKTEDLAKNRKM